MHFDWKSIPEAKKKLRASYVTLFTSTCPWKWAIFGQSRTRERWHQQYQLRGSLPRRATWQFCQSHRTGLSYCKTPATVFHDFRHCYVIWTSLNILRHTSDVRVTCQASYIPEQEQEDCQVDGRPSVDGTTILVQIRLPFKGTSVPTSYCSLYKYKYNIGFHIHHEMWTCRFHTTRR